MGLVKYIIGGHFPSRGGSISWSAVASVLLIIRVHEFVLTPNTWSSQFMPVQLLGALSTHIGVDSATRMRGNNDPHVTGLCVRCYH